MHLYFLNWLNKLIKAFSDTNIEIVYGSTEAEPISFIKAENLVKYAGQVIKTGLPAGDIVDDIELKIIKIVEGPVNEEEFNNLILPESETGEICVSGNHVLKEYYNNQEAQKQNKICTNDKIWHRTGDAGYIKENTLYLIGRARQRFIYNDKIYYLFPYENALANINGVKIATIIEHDNNVLIVIEPEEAINNNKYNILSEIKRLEIPHNEIMIIKQIPRDARHCSKIDYERLKKIL